MRPAPAYSKFFVELNPCPVPPGVAGVAIFVALVQVVFAVACRSYRKRGDRTLALIILTWPFLTVRGIYGILSVVIASWSCESQVERESLQRSDANSPLEPVRQTRTQPPTR